MSDAPRSVRVLTIIALLPVFLPLLSVTYARLSCALVERLVGTRRAGNKSNAANEKKTRESSALRRDTRLTAGDCGILPRAPERRLPIRDKLDLFRVKLYLKRQIYTRNNWF